MVKNGARKPGNLIDFAVKGLSFGNTSSASQGASNIKRNAEKLYNKSMRVVAGAYYKSKQD